MKKNKLLSYFLAISVATFITIFFIIVAKSYDNLVKPLNIVQNNSPGKAINLDLKLDVIDLIEKRNSEK